MNTLKHLYSLFFILYFLTYIIQLHLAPWKKKYPSHILLPLTVNTDGAKVFKSSSYSLWLIQLYQGYLTPSERYKIDNVMIKSTSVQKKPCMREFFYPFLTIWGKSLMTMELVSYTLANDISSYHLCSIVVQISRQRLYFLKWIDIPGNTLVPSAIIRAN